MLSDSEEFKSHPGKHSRTLFPALSWHFISAVKPALVFPHSPSAEQYLS